ncbi:hypothetical protein MKW11_05955 [Gluconobacter frateurii]|uniref:hypothetical protein n=1 Tax=Gluconobacter frateurii TaxID=38308 RepID=UPI001F057701|nr:hypothetical protein [Gluconobacter frateurii]UMM09600.1 hypothetical protein MKW11_05955 [Gluconobacter frateurii]
MKRKSNIKMRHLDVVKNLYKIQNLKNASDVMSITPAAISKSCIEFEKIIGKTLFSRTRKGFIPNDIAKRVVESSILIEKEIDRMIVDIDNIYNDQKYISISFQSNSIISAMMNCVLNLKRKKGINFSINYGSRDHIFSNLLKGKTDIIFASTYSEIIDDRLDYKYIVKDECVIFDRTNIYTVDYIIKNWKTLQSKIWILPVRGTAMRDKFESILEYNGLKSPKNLIEINSTIGATNFIDNDDTIGMSPLSFLKKIKYEAGAKEVSDGSQKIILDVGIFWRKNSREIVSSTVNDLTKEIIENI